MNIFELMCPIKTDSLKLSCRIYENLNAVFSFNYFNKILLKWFLKQEV